MKLTDTTRKFIVHWGEMGTRWGINHSVAQIHALFYVSSAPLTAEEIAGTLDIARSVVSGSLRGCRAGTSCGRPTYRAAAGTISRRPRTSGRWSRSRSTAGSAGSRTLPCGCFGSACRSLTSRRPTRPIRRAAHRAAGAGRTGRRLVRADAETPPAALRRLFKLGDKIFKLVE